MKTTNLFLKLMFVGTLFITACSKDVNPDEGIYGPGIYVCNEGAFGQSNGSISYIPRNTYQAYNNIYAQANNNAVLGDVAQSIQWHNNKFYIVVNNSNKVVVVNAENFNNTATITDRQLPRYMAFNNNKGYLTEWVSFSSNGKLSVIDLNTNNVTKQIELGKLPEKLLVHNNQAFVVNSNDSTMHVINLSSETVDYVFSIGDYPNSIVKDANNKLWILCGGVPAWTGSPTPGKLVRFNPTTQSVELSLTFSSTDANPNNLCINKAGNELYYYFNGNIFKMSTSATSLPTSPFIASTFSTYGLGVDPSTGYIFVADAGNFTNNGVVRWYSNSSTLIDTAVVGIAPNGFYFWQ